VRLKHAYVQIYLLLPHWLSNRNELYDKVCVQQEYAQTLDGAKHKHNDAICTIVVTTRELARPASTEKYAHTQIADTYILY